ncbi:methionine adenosyltransferase [Gemella sanguinis]|jgi:methionine adenosyltransferase|uniref:S-adenosylmethionine synthase n=1 Tax=Gemella sanguinis TaxID=84135 RepID=A0ABX6FI79_9BACL|nr:methionine adenosyltransferase [Gemella sanguinis]EGF86617.1 methionine adenosyltransferase [Gemella sanguinis M325]QGS07206.1 methionine adenosyltransferase [Gemella sanguinis]
MSKTYLFTSESVTEGHPDKIADQVSDAILDEILKQDPYGRVACETCVNTGLAVLIGEVSTTANVDFQQVVRDTVNEIGYNDPTKGYSGDHISVLVGLDKQSPDIALGVDNSLETKQEKEENEVGAGDQGLMFGFATNETPSYMPLPIYLSHKLSKQLADVRKNGTLTYLGPDGKVQVTVEYDINHKVKRIDTIVVSTQHAEEISQEQIHADIKKYVIEPCLDKELLDEDTKYFINPTGRFVIGGPVGDAGLTGRKIIVDTYGGFSRHGGGAFSGKDATKVDRSGAYMARYIAKNIVASGICDKVEVQLAYAIGVAHPVSIFIETFGTSKVDEGEIVKTIKEEFRLTPNGIIETLDLRRPIYKKTAAYGHFGREDEDFTWEKTDKVESFRKLLK